MSKDKAFEEWIIVNHPLWKKPAALVGLRDSRFVGYIPLMDPRDANGDGNVSTGEWLVSKMPIFGNLSREAEIGSVMMAIAMGRRVLFHFQFYSEDAMFDFFAGRGRSANGAWRPALN